MYILLYEKKSIYLCKKMYKQSYLLHNTYESLSFIITTNRSPAEWAQSLNDEVLATALLDRLLYKCELIQLSGGSYRMKNRKTIFE